MGKRNKEEKSFNKLLIMLIALISSFFVLIASTYAWITLSTAPEIVGIKTKVGSNGSLEIALLDDDTYNNLANIQTNIGDSNIVKDLKDSNVTWGNIVDLSDDSYGLENIGLNPSVLNVSNGYVGTSILKTAKFGHDGRISKLIDTINAKCIDGVFSEKEGSYGVRAIGTSNSLSVQEATLRNCRSSINSGINTVRKQAIDGFEKHGGLIVDLICDHKNNNTELYSLNDINNIKEYLLCLKQAITTSRNIVKESVIVYLCSMDISEEQFVVLKNQIDKASDLRTIQNISGMYYFDDVTNIIENDIILINSLLSDCDKLIEDNNYSYASLEKIIEKIVNPNGILINDYGIDEAIENQDTIINEALNNGFIFTINPDCGLASDIASLADEYSCRIIINSLGNLTSTVTFKKAIEVSYLNGIKLYANSTVSNQKATFDIKIDDSYGYVIDLAFRTNAANSYLLLQQEGSQRIYSDSLSSETMGLGSFMSFHSNSLSEDKMVEMMNAIRIAFVSNDQSLIAMGRLNINNLFTTDNDSLAARIYLYDYHEDNGNIILDKRRENDSRLVELYQNTPIAISCIVYLDGNYVDNTMAAATLKKTMTGMLNLNFASTADLVPMSITQMYSLSANVENLETLLKTYENLYTGENKNNRYIQVLYDDFVREYEYCSLLLNDEKISTSIIRSAINNLQLAYDSLEYTDDTTIESLILQAEEDYGLKVNFDEEKNEYYIEAVREYNKENELYKEYVGTYKQTHRKAFENALIESYALYQNSLKDDTITEDEIVNSLAILSAANKVLSANKYFDYEPYILNNTIYYRGTNDNWYFKNNYIFNLINSNETIITLDNFALKVNMVEYKQLLHKDSDNQEKLENYYLGSDGYWYERRDHLISYIYDDIQNAYNEVAYLVIHQNETDNLWTRENENGFDIIAYHYYQRVDDYTEQLIKAAVANVSFVMDNNKILTNSSINNIYINISSSTETIKYAEYSINNPALLSVSSSNKIASITSNDKSGIATINCKIVTNNGNEYTCYKNIEIVSLTPYLYQDKTYYLGSDNLWYFNNNLVDLVTNESIINDLNKLK